MTEVLYDMRDVRRILRLIAMGVRPRTQDAVIEYVDVERAFLRLPIQYQAVIHSWVEAEGDDGQHDFETMVMELEEDEEWIKQTLEAAWSHLETLLNP